jgi:hypothetical protein
MKIQDLFENGDHFTVKCITYYVGRRSKDTAKNIFDPFIKNVNKEMRALKGKWNGRDGYTFKREDQAKAAQDKMNELAGQWKQMLNDFPENKDFSLDAEVADKYFKDLKKSAINGIK